MRADPRDSSARRSYALRADETSLDTRPEQIWRKSRSRKEGHQEVKTNSGPERNEGEAGRNEVVGAIDRCISTFSQVEGGGEGVRGKRDRQQGRQRRARGNITLQKPGKLLFKNGVIFYNRINVRFPNIIG